MKHAAVLLALFAFAACAHPEAHLDLPAPGTSSSVIACLRDHASAAGWTVKKADPRQGLFSAEKMERHSDLLGLTIYDEMQASVYRAPNSARVAVTAWRDAVQSGARSRAAGAGDSGEAARAIAAPCSSGAAP